MTYRIRPGALIDEAVRRVGLDQVEKALAEIRDPALDRHHVVHQVRKRCKKVRALLRLVRPALGDAYAVENARFRDASRFLSDLRDAQVFVEAQQRLLSNEEGGVDPETARRLHEALAARRDRMARLDPPIDERLARFAERMESSRDAVSAWRLDDGKDAMVAGFRRTYRRGRKRYRKALDDPSPERLHEWRKRVKYHGYHLRLLAELAGRAHDAHHRRVEELGELLGRDHDLAMLRELLLDDPDVRDVAPLGDAVRRLEGRRRELQSSILALGAQAFEAKPKKLVRQLELD